jgi:hypothetical protein
MTALDVSVCTSPFFSVTRTSGADVPSARLAVPSTTDTLFFFIRNATPALSFFAGSLERCTVRARSNDGLSADTPWCPSRDCASYISPFSAGLSSECSPVQTDSAEVTALDDRGLQAQLRGTYRCDVPARARANNCQIKCVCHVGTINKIWMSVLRTRTPRTDRSKVGCGYAYSSYESARVQ